MKKGILVKVKRNATLSAGKSRSFYVKPNTLGMTLEDCKQDSIVINLLLEDGKIGLMFINDLVALEKNQWQPD